ncbi:MAG: ATP-binding protein, partial [Methylibium sp.]|nr:ATP-binding protein [Methylibium sp.]
MKDWINRAMAVLHASLEPPRHELNELDWKSALSPDKRRLAEHLSAFANQPGGGFLVYGIANDGTPTGLTAQAVEDTMNSWPT